MRPVHRAAIGGLFAIWLAPLAAGPCGGADCRCAGACEERRVQDGDDTAALRASRAETATEAKQG